MCTFEQSGAQLGIDVSEVQEVLRADSLGRVPGAPRAVQGLLNLRGQILLALDLGRALELPASTRPSHERMHIVLLDQDVSLLVDEVGEVVEVAPTDRAPPPEHLDPALASTVQAVCQSPLGSFLLLSPAALLERALGSWLKDANNVKHRVEVES